MTFTVYQFNSKARTWVKYEPVEATTRPDALRAARAANKENWIAGGTVVITQPGSVDEQKYLKLMGETHFQEVLKKVLP
jgi:hypothetical protein